ncbi:nucleolar and coiled-body phosphoprotein 1 [Cajanus cajan]|uniref:Nucleolar phosphoprotein p130 family n=1 Tax=Cajanus cajan TaxID=3821 RepID=A0A151SCL3_CAJCA|nr:nucleolar and coiled-body phosphoprotein 1 [Cajanus cajan]KYP52552.1 Nucleolar phosphoprotein p130 family [Cajanus cajan]
MPATPSSNKGISTLFAFTPRQVLLTMKHTAHNSKLFLHQSIARYLERSGFSKTLKKFRSEAQFEKDDLEGTPVDLEEMCLKYLEICGKDDKSNIDDQNELAVHSKNKDGKSKEKKKKKSKLVSESLANNVEGNQLDSVTTVAKNKVKDDVSADAKVINGSKTEKRSKSKTKKNDKRDGQGDAIEHIGDPNESVLTEENIEELNKEMKHEEKKDSKKRKRPISEENGQQVADIKADDEAKRRKIENLSGNQLQKTSKEQSNGNLENDGEKSSVQRSQKKQQKGSVEQKPVKAAFQRVQVDKIQFADERLQDNSYWAKDGAENGYGAKAAEILDQVRGRDFRHEKTKKKRGTYRGGHIDLHSHSVKFNYSDDE